jgi:hypothetical protein
MDIIKTYLTNVNNVTTRGTMVDNYKIITVNDNNPLIKPFLIYDTNALVLNSKSLIRLLKIKSIPCDILNRMLDNYSQTMKHYVDMIIATSNILYEERLFFDFDPYNNFLLTNNTKNKDIKDIIARTTNYQYMQQQQSLPGQMKEYDFSRMVNPYGLEKVVFTGGGIKGIIYIGAFLGLLATGQVFYLNHFAGTSVGALTSMIAGCVTPSSNDYNILKKTSLRDILTRGEFCPIVERYQEAIEFTMERFVKRNIDSFYKAPDYTFYGMWTALDTIVKNNGLYDPQKSGFQIWYALICKKICQIMKNGLDKLIIIKKKDGTFVEFPDIECTKFYNFSRKNNKRNRTGSECERNRTGSECEIPTKSTTNINPPDKSTTNINPPDKSTTNINLSDKSPNATIKTNVEEKKNSSNLSDKQSSEDKQSDVCSSPLLQEDKSKEFEKLYKEYCGNIEFDTDMFSGWELVRFFTFQEYHDLTDKTLVMTGTKTKCIETVYYTHTDKLYKDLSVMTGAMASMSIPWVFKAPVIDGSYNLDGGIYDNYPLTHCDKKVKDRITHYNNKIFGYLIDDKSTIIDAYEIIRELWLVYDGFIEIMNIGYLKDTPNYAKISELFFEIRLEVYKLLYFTDVDLETFLSRDINREKVSGFSICDLEEIFEQLKYHAESSDDVNFNLPKKGVGFIEEQLKNLDTHYKNFESVFKIGKKTDLSDVMELAVRHGEAYNRINMDIIKDLEIIEKMPIKIKIVTRYEEILKHIMRNIFSYYELKGTFILTNDLEHPSIYFAEIMKNLYKKLEEFEKLTNEGVELIVKSKKEPGIKNYINNSIQIAISMISKILTRGSGNNIDLSDTDLLNKGSSSYQKLVDYFFHTDMPGIMFKYICIANDRICSDSYNKIRTIKLNTFETATLQFDMNDELKCRLIYEGYSKTIKYFTNLLHLIEITERPRSSDEYLESIELRYKKMI